MANVYSWNVYERNTSSWGNPWVKCLGSVIAYNEKEAFAKATKEFEWDRVGGLCYYRGPEKLFVKKGSALTGRDLGMWRLDQQFDDEQTIPTSHICKDRLVGIIRRHKGYEDCDAEDIVYVHVRKWLGKVYYLISVRNKYVLSIGR